MRDRHQSKIAEERSFGEGYSRLGASASLVAGSTAPSSSYRWRHRI